MGSEPSKNLFKYYSNSIKSFFKEKEWVVVIYLVVVLFAASNFLQDRSISDHEYQIATGSVSSPVKEISEYSMSGISIGNNISSLSVIGKPPTMKENVGKYTLEKYPLIDGNKLHVTYSREDRKILYLETYWGDLKTGAPNDFKGFIYGKTTLKDINNRVGNNGYTYSAKPPVSYSDDGELITLSSYELENAIGQVVTFITRVTPERVKYLNENNIQDGIDEEFRLVSVILADSSYLDEIWGAKKVYDKNYKPIKLQ